MSSTHLISTLILLLGFRAQSVWLDSNSCRSCMTNGGFCLDESRYYKCKGTGVLPDTSAIYECAENEVCSKQGVICVARSEVVESNIACREDLACGKCPENYEWPTAVTCVSATAYRTCESGGLNSLSVECPTGSQCSQQAHQHTGRICLPANIIEELEYEVTCEESDALKFSPAHQDLLNCCEQFGAARNVGCFNVQNVYDSQCKSFIKCQRVEGLLEASLENCSEGYYYDQSVDECVQEKPRGCGA